MDSAMPHEPSPFEDLEVADLMVRDAALTEEAALFDPDEVPKPPSPKEEATTSLDGVQTVDMMRDTPPIELEVGLVDLE